MNNLPKIKLGEIIDLKYGKPISKDDRDVNGVNFVYGANGVLERTNKFLVEGENIIVGRKGSAGQVNRVTGKCWPSDVTYYVSLKEKAEIDYIYFLLKHLNLPSLAKGVKPGLNRNDVYKFEVIMPSVEDQKRIVRILDQANSLRQKRKQAIKLLDDYLKSVFMEMFGDPITNAKQWKITEFSNLCSKIFGGGTPSKSKPEYYDGKIPWVTPKDMKLRFISDSEDHISNDAVINSSVKMIPSNSVLMVIRSGILKSKLPVAINTMDVTVNQDMKAYIINSAIANPYFVLFFFEIAQHYLLSKVRSVTADNIKFGDIKGCPIILPLIELQNKFSEIVCKTELLKQKMLLQSQKLDTQFQALMQKSFNKIN